jgi:6-phosphogluconate dehydrogenase (decarboxylating)
VEAGGLEEFLRELVKPGAVCVMLSAGEIIEGATKAVPAVVLSAALYGRFREHAFVDRILSDMLKGFGVHIEPKVGPV